MAFASKVLVITSSCDCSEFIALNNTKQHNSMGLIENKYSQLGVKCVNILQEIHDCPYLDRSTGGEKYEPSGRNVNVVQYALDHYRFSHEGIVAILDSDFFIVREFSIEEFLKESLIRGINQKIGYLWVEIAFFDMRMLFKRRTLNFNWERINSSYVDAKGYSCHYLQNHPEISMKFFYPAHSAAVLCPPCSPLQGYVPCAHNRADLEARHFDEARTSLLQSGCSNIEFFLDRTFFHCRMGSNWNRQSPDYHAKKMGLVRQYVNRILGS